MKALAWYSVILNSLIVIFMLLSAVKVIPPAPFSPFEAIVWGILTVPIIIFAVRVIKKFL